MLSLNVIDTECDIADSHIFSGAFRKGKSFLLNFMLRYLKVTFPISSHFFQLCICSDVTICSRVEVARIGWDPMAAILKGFTGGNMTVCTISTLSAQCLTDSTVST